MNRDEHRLKRLLKAARKPGREIPPSIPFALEARIIARWRSSAPEEKLELLSMVSLFRRAMVCAVLVMIASVGWSQLSNVHEVPGATALANFVQDIQIIP
jgi:membrane glycosyltransferase